MRVKLKEPVLDAGYNDVEGQGGGGGGDVKTFCFEGRSNLMQMAPWPLKQFAAARLVSNCNNLM